MESNETGTCPIFNSKRLYPIWDAMLFLREEKRGYDMKKNITALTIVLFFVGSIGVNHDWITHAVGTDKEPKADRITPEDSHAKKMKNSPLRSNLVKVELAPTKKSSTKLDKKAKNVALATPKKAAEKTPVASRSQKEQSPVPKGYTAQDLLWLSRIIHAEAKGEPFTGKVAVGAVILNRVEHHEFPKTIYKVIHHRQNGVYQFQPVANGKIQNKPDQQSIEAAKQALKGKDPSKGSLFFYNPKISRSSWMSRLNHQIRIGNHVFASL